MQKIYEDYEFKIFESYRNVKYFIIQDDCIIFGSSVD
jgi:hypothetical protein